MTLTIKETSDVINALIEGRLDTATSVQFAQDMKPLLDNAGKHIVIDCECMDYISSSGLRLFLSLRKASMAAGGKMTIKNLQEGVKQVFEVTGFVALFEIV